MISIPVWEKAVLNLKEASGYSGIGINRLREITSSDRCGFVLRVGNHRHIKRKKFEEYLEKSFFNLSGNKGRPFSRTPFAS